MKLLFLSLLVFSMNSQAQYKLEVLDLQGNVLGGGEYATQELAEAACEANCGSGAFGQKERLVPLDGSTEEERALALEIIPANEQEGTPSLVRVRKTYSHTITDVTAQRTSAAALSSALRNAQKAMDCGRSAQALLLVRNATKGLTTTQIKQMVSTYSSIKQLLDTGSLVSSIEEIEEIEADGILVTESDKTALVIHINGCKP